MEIEFCFDSDLIFKLKPSGGWSIKNFVKYNMNIVSQAW